MTKTTSAIRLVSLVGAVSLLICSGCTSEQKETAAPGPVTPVASPVATESTKSAVPVPKAIPGVDPKVNQTIQQDFKDAKN